MQVYQNLGSSLGVYESKLDYISEFTKIWIYNRVN